MENFPKNLNEKIKNLEERFIFLTKCIQAGFFFTNLVFIIMILLIIKYARVAQW